MTGAATYARELIGMPGERHDNLSLEVLCNEDAVARRTGYVGRQSSFAAGAASALAGRG